MDDHENNTLVEALGLAIRARRESLGRSQETLAHDVGVHRTYLGAIERGERNPSLRNLCRIARALSMSLSDLFKEAEQTADRLAVGRGRKK
ncbi:MAG: helix-turn-helix transcriptional regulator [Rubrobacteraceae bacterium]|nr:helix-turn-helix transcriptional regulator [Rubrobacteraceae bacterium]